MYIVLFQLYEYDIYTKRSKFTLVLCIPFIISSSSFFSSHKADIILHKSKINIFISTNHHYNNFSLTFPTTKRKIKSNENAEM